MAARGGERLRDWLRLLRAPLAPTAAWDVLAATALATTAAGRGLDALSLGAWSCLALSGLLVYGAGMVWNDVADRDRDRTLAPDRPLPSGRIGATTAFVGATLLAVAAVALGGGPGGHRGAVAAAVAGAFLYDFLLKRRGVAVGALAMGFVRFANAATGVLPWVLTGDAPAWILLGPGAVGLYSLAITVWSATEDVDPASSAAARLRGASRSLAAVAFGTAGVLSWVVPGHLTLGTVMAFGPFSSLVFARRPKPGPAKRQVLEMLLALYLLSMCLAATGDGGSLPVNGVAFVVAFGLIYVTQIGIRALRRPPPA